MNLNLDHWAGMQLSIFSKQDLDLLDRARKALLPIQLSAKVPRMGGAYISSYEVEALLHPQLPITLDFRAFHPDTIGQAYFTEKYPLSEDLFDGDVFKKSFVDTITEHFKDFIEHMRMD